MSTSTGSPAVWPDLITALDAGNGVHRVSMESLRLLEGAQRLGPHVISTIDERLKMFGIGHIPLELPNRGEEAVLLYRQGTTASEVIRAITEGLNGSSLEAALTALRRLNALQGAPAALSAQEIAIQAQKAREAVDKLLEMTTESYRK